MILQKLASAIRRQDWFQVLIEVMIVIVGIFLGLQVQAWNEDRINQSEETRLIDAMTSEVREILAIRNAQFEELTAQQEAVEEALAILFGQDENQSLTDKHCFAFRNSHNRSTAWNDIPITSVEEIVVSGKLNTIENPKLRTAILRLRSISISVSSRIDLLKARDAILFSKFPELIQTKFSIFNNGPETTAAECDFENIKLNPGFLNDLQANRARKGALINFAKEELSALNDVLHLLN